VTADERLTLERAIRDAREANANLTHVQDRCTALIKEARAFRASLVSYMRVSLKMDTASIDMILARVDADSKVALRKPKS
jgi:hypothetical protein